MEEELIDAWTVINKLYDAFIHDGEMPSLEEINDAVDTVIAVIQAKDNVTIDRPAGVDRDCLKITKETLAEIQKMHARAEGCLLR